MKKIIIISVPLIVLCLKSFSQSGWVQIYSVQNSPYFDVFFVDTSYGFTGSQNNILKTTNGGYNWTYNYVDSSYLTEVYFLSTSTGFLISLKQRYPVLPNIYKIFRTS